MSNKTDSRRAISHELPCDARAEAILEFVFNDEEQALCNEEFALSHHDAMPAVQEFLKEMGDIDERPAADRWH